MSTRSIKVYTTVGVSGTVETNVRTLGELKPILRQQEIDYSGMKMLVGETKNELNVDDAVLPEGDFKLYLVPQKTKSGSIEDTLEEIQEEQAEQAAKLNEILSILKGNGGAVAASPSASVAKSRISLEDQKALDEIRSMSSNQW
jgi:hypothetical protein